jgi:hypothetical protein
MTSSVQQNKDPPQPTMSGADELYDCLRNGGQTITHLSRFALSVTRPLGECQVVMEMTSRVKDLESGESNG